MVKLTKKTAQQKPKHEDEPEPEDTEVENGDEEEEGAEEEAPAEAPAPNEAPAEGEGEGAGEAVTPPAASHKITVEGEGSFPLVVAGAMKRIQRGEPVEVTDEQLAAIKELGEKVKKS